MLETNYTPTVTRERPQQESSYLVLWQNRVYRVEDIILVRPPVIKVDLAEIREVGKCRDEITSIWVRNSKAVGL